MRRYSVRCGAVPSSFLQCGPQLALLTAEVLGLFQALASGDGQMCPGNDTVCLPAGSAFRLLEKITDVAGPPVLHQDFHGIRGYRRQLDVAALAPQLQGAVGQVWDLLPSRVHR